jgi:thioester reductase-like protein
VTGFPGFLGTELLPRVLRRAPDTDAVCLVQRKFARLARSRLEQLELAHPGMEERVRLVEGDITLPDLGLGDESSVLASATTEIYHLAAIYDLSVSRELGFRVNVHGTRNLLAFARECPGLARFHYMSTCYVSGRYPGIFSEDDLGKSQDFNNFYEETKFLAELDVHEALVKGMPGTVYRPSIVVGDSQTGETQKYDGPYYMIRWLLRQPRLALLAVVGNPRHTRVNVVPRDYVVEAVAHLSGLAHSVGRVYQLADHQPLTVEEMLKEIGRATGRRIIPVPMPRGVAKWALDKVPGLQRLMRIPPESVDYFVHPTHYATFNARTDLEGSGIGVPPFGSYVDRLVRFVREHPEIGSDAMA